MCAAESGAFGRLSPRAGHRRRRSGLDATDRRIASEVAVLRLAANGVRTQPGRPRRQPQARAKADARDGDRGAGSAPRHQQSRARPQDLSLSAAGVSITEPNHVWASDITYIPMALGFLYLVAIIDWASRAVLAWRLSNTMDAGFCIAALDEA